MDWRNYLFSFHGRVNRAKMWLFYVVVWALEFGLIAVLAPIVAALMVTGVIDKNSGEDDWQANLGMWFLVAIFAAFAVMVDYIYLAVAAKRLHDRDKSAWWILVFFVVPAALIIAPVIFFSMGGNLAQHGNIPSIATPFLLVGMGLNIWGFVELHFLCGTTGENRFGADPLPQKTLAGSG